MRSTILLLAAAATVAACTTSVPDSGAEATGVGFGDYRSYQQQREAELAGRATAGLGTPVSGERAPLSALAPAATPQTEAERLAAETRATLGIGTTPAAAPVTTAAAAPAAPAGPVRLSDENSFEAVAARETIESDRARLEERRAEFEVVQPTALPQRPGDTGPNIVAYALATSHPRGQALYRRVTLFGGDARNCNRYSNANEAQEVFLAAGGPERDRHGLDPDGDGYACGWDPTPFRLAAQARQGN